MISGNIWSWDRCYFCGHAEYLILNGMRPAVMRF